MTTVIRRAVLLLTWLHRRSSKATTNWQSSTSSNTTRLKTEKPTNVATYCYSSLNSDVELRKIKRSDKVFRWQHKNGDGTWKSGRDKQQPDLYRRAEWSDSDHVYVVEGEKDADNLSKIGLQATTSADGAGKWNEKYNQSFSEKKVTILIDNDSEGIKHGDLVASNILGTAAGVKVINLMPDKDKGDVSDWLNAGGTKEQLLKIIKDAPVYRKTDKRSKSSPENGGQGGRPKVPVADIANEFAEKHTDKNRHFLIKYYQGQWYKFNGRYYENMALDDLRNSVTEFLEKRL